jgi:hypothetical protein
MPIRLLLILFLCIVTRSGYANGPEKVRELVLQVPELDEWTVHRIREGLSRMKGVRLCGYYQDDSCLLIKYDPDSRSAGTIIRTIEAIARVPKNVVEITDHTFFDILDGQLCTDRESADAATKSD